MDRTSSPKKLSTSHPVEAEQLPLPLVSRAVLATPEQAADLLGVTPRALERWRASGDGPRYVRLSRSTIRYRVEDLDAFVASCLCASTAPGGGRPD